MILFYNICMNILMVAFFLLLPVIYLFSEKRRQGLLARSSLSMTWGKKRPGEKRVWIHALSVGEVKSAVPLVKRLKQRQELLKIIFSVSTRTGFETAKQVFFKPGTSSVDQLGYFPFDFRWSVRRAAELIGPDAAVIVETDIWPNFLFEMEKRNIPSILINARLSERSLNGYSRCRPFFSKIFSLFSQILVQSPLDKERYLKLGIPEEKIQVAGNLKFDQPAEDLEGQFVEKMKKDLGIKQNSLVLIGGSTHEGEETLLCRVYQRLKSRYPALIMILAPRDPARCRDLLPEIHSAGLSVCSMSSLQEPLQEAGIVLVDQMGILSRLYALCQVAYIGGSLVREGGHNPLEPAMFSKPVLFGPDMSDFLMISELLTRHGGAKQIRSENELYHELDTLLGDPHTQKQMGSFNREVFLMHSGAVENIIRSLEDLHIV